MHPPPLNDAISHSLVELQDPRDSCPNYSANSQDPLQPFEDRLGARCPFTVPLKFFFSVYSIFLPTLEGPRIASERRRSSPPGPSSLTRSFPEEEAGMARTKPTDALSKILRAEILRLQQLKNNPEFQREVQTLQAIAKRLASVSSGRFPVSGLSRLREKDLLPTADEETFHEEAEHFKEKWGFRPRWGDDGRVELFTCSPVSFEMKLSTHSATWKLNEEQFPYGDVDSLAKYYRGLRKRSLEKKGQLQRRRRPDTAELRMKALELAAQGKSHREIAEALFPDEYRDAIKTPPDIRRKLYGLINKYFTDNKMSWADAERKAARDLGLDILQQRSFIRRPEPDRDARPPTSTKLQKLTHRVRRYLGKLDG
jgi:hypothetical protein